MTCIIWLQMTEILNQIYSVIILIYFQPHPPPYWPGVSLPAVPRPLAWLESVSSDLVTTASPTLSVHMVKCAAQKVVARFARQQLPGVNLTAVPRPLVWQASVSSSQDTTASMTLNVLAVRFAAVKDAGRCVKSQHSSLKEEAAFVNKIACL